MAYTDVIYEVDNQIAWLTINRHYYHTDEAKEMGRAFNDKGEPDPEKFYR